MKIGYPCINRTLGCRGNRAFRLASYSPARLIETLSGNLHCLRRMLEFNARNRIFFFRITSDLVPFASHPVNTFDWGKHFKDDFRHIGKFILTYAIRINMHPDQFILLNSPSEEVTRRSLAELAYHCRVLDLLGLDSQAKIQLHVGGVYGDKRAAVERFVRRYRALDAGLRRRLVVENDHVNYSLEDCLRLNAMCGVPVVLDVFHEEVLTGAFDPRQAIGRASRTWERGDGIAFVDYSIQARGGRKGAHAESIDTQRFGEFLKKTRPIDFDVMLEIKDKERSALKAVAAAEDDERFFGARRESCA